MSRERCVKFKRIECEAQRAYLAGIIDIMGTFCIKRNQSGPLVRWTSRLVISTTEYKILDTLNDMLGVQRLNDDHWKFNEKPITWEDRMPKKVVKMWGCNGDFLDYVLSITLPYLIVNKEKALLIQEFRATFPGVGKHPVPQHIQELRESLRDKFQTLQRKKRYHPKVGGNYE